MPRITVDFSDVEDFEALPKGDYQAVIAKAEYRDFPEEPDRHPYINLEMDVSDGEAKGRKLWSILSFSPKALWRMKQVFENLGIYMDELDIDVDEDTNAVLSPELVGLPVICSVSRRVYEGREQNQVDAITSPDAKKGGSAKAPAKRPAKAAAKKFK